MNDWHPKYHRKLAAWLMATCLGGCAADSSWNGFTQPHPSEILPPALAREVTDSEIAARPEHWAIDLPTLARDAHPVPALQQPRTEIAFVAAETSLDPSGDLPACGPVTRLTNEPVRLAMSESNPPAQIEAPKPIPLGGEHSPSQDFTSPLAPGVEGSCEGMPLELSSALMMAAGRNPQVAFAQEQIREAYSRHQAAEVLWLPSLRAGVTYYKHDGTLQDVKGPVTNISRSGLYSGAGARAIGAGNPAIPGVIAQFALNDAIHRPEITAWQTDAQNHAANATRNQVLLDTALAYLELLEAYQQKAIALETLANAQKLAELTKSFAKAGEGLQADADRAATELTVRQNAVEQAEEAIQVASARLAERLSVDPTVGIFPTESTLIPMDLIACERTVQELVSTGLQSRPELAENTALVQAAAHELRRVRQAPILPSVLLGMSYGGFGGGLGDTITNYRDRFDFEATAFWEVRNLGFGEKAQRKEALSQQQQAQIRQVRVMDRVAREVAEAQSQVEARRRQIEIARQGIESARDSHRRNLERIQDGQGLPIEVLQSLQALDAARREYLRTVVSYNQAQFRLQWAIGWPVS